MCVRLLLPTLKFTLNVFDMPSFTPLEKNEFSLFQQVLISNSFLTRYEIFCSLHFMHAIILYGCAGLVQALCMCAITFSVNFYVSELFVPENGISLESFITSDS